MTGHCDLGPIYPYTLVTMNTMPGDSQQLGSTISSLKLPWPLPPIPQALVTTFDYISKCWQRHRISHNTTVVL